MSPPMAAPASPADAEPSRPASRPSPSSGPICGRTAAPDLQRRVFLAFGLLLVAKVVTMVTPFTFKWATDALVAVTGGAAVRRRGGGDAGFWLWRAPHPARRRSTACRASLMALLTQVRDGLFAKVAMHAVRQLALRDLRAHAPARRCASISSARPAA